MDLSYLDLKTMTMLARIDPAWQPIRDRSLKILLQGTRRNGFYFDKYDVREKRYYDQEKNFINQLICAIHLAEAGEPVKTFFDFLLKEWHNRSRLLGGYDSGTRKGSVTYESTAVYALALRLALVTNNTGFARAMKDRIRELASEQRNPLWKGSFCKYSCHAFDHLQALLSFILSSESSKRGELSP